MLTLPVDVTEVVREDSVKLDVVPDEEAVALVDCLDWEEADLDRELAAFEEYDSCDELDVLKGVLVIAEDDTEEDEE